LPWLSNTTTPGGEHFSVGANGAPIQTALRRFSLLCDVAGNGGALTLLSGDFRGDKYWLTGISRPSLLKKSQFQQPSPVTHCHRNCFCFSMIS